MAKKTRPKAPDQTFAGGERLFRRVRRDNVARNGKPTLLAFALPDVSVDREKYGRPEGARKGFDKTDWAVAAFVVDDIPPRKNVEHISQIYRLLVRHVPESGNFAHSEVRIWRCVDNQPMLITAREASDFDESDPDRDETRDTPERLLDPDFHMRWRKHIALAAKMVLPCQPVHST